MAGYPPPYPPPGFDPRAQRRFLRDQARMQRDAMRAQREQMRYQMRGMRRGSILGPTLLIAVGVIFLLMQTGRLDRSHFWGWYGHWWPLLLVGAGVVVLAEWALDQFMLRDPQTPRYRRSIGGGVFTLLLIIGGVGFVADQARMHINGDHWLYGWQSNLDNLDEFLGDKHESDQNLDFAFTSGGLSVVNPRGDVTVSGTSDDNRIHIAIHKQVYASSDSDADNKTKQLTPTTNIEGSTFALTMPAIEGTRSDLVITVPAAAATTITANRGDIHISSIKAPVSVTANRGDIELSAITGQTTAHINNHGSSITARSMDGDIAIQGHAQDLTLTDVTGGIAINGEFFGTTHLQHINGAIHFHTSRTDLQLARLDGETEISSSGISADQVMGPVVVTTSNRNITLERIAGDIAVTNRNGTIDLTAAPTVGNITVENRDGAIHTTLPDKASFTMQARTTNGNVSTDFQLQTSGSEDNKSLTGTVGAGGPAVHITTTNAEISVRKGDILPLSPIPPAPPRITMLPPPVMPKTPHAPKLPPAPRAPSVPKAPPALPAPPASQ